MEKQELLVAITEKMDEIFGKIQVENASLREEMREVKQEVKLMKQEMVQLKQEMGQLKLEVVQLKQEMGQLKLEVGQLKQEMGQLKLEVGQLKYEMVEVKKHLNDLDQRMVKQDLRLQLVEANVSELTRNVAALNENMFAMLSNFNIHQHKQNNEYEEFKGYFELLRSRMDKLESSQAETNRRLESLEETVKVHNVTIAELHVVR